MLSIKEDLKAIGFIPPTPEGYKEYEFERLWSLVTGEGVKVAICFTYLAATSVENHKKHNEML